MTQRRASTVKAEERSRRRRAVRTTHPTVGDDVCRVLGGRKGVPSRFWLSTLKKALAAAADERPAAVSLLVQQLSGGDDAAALRTQLLRDAELRQPKAQQSTTADRFGTARQRTQLIEELRDRAIQEGQAGARATAQAAARAALFLAAHDVLPNGTAILHALVADDRILDALGLGKREVEQLKAILSHDRELRGYFFQQLLKAAQTLQLVIDAPSAAELDPVHVERLLRSLDLMWRLSAGHADLERRHAQLVSRLAGLAEAREDKVAMARLETEVSHWLAATRDPVVKRWLREALEDPPQRVTCTGVRLMTEEQLRQRMISPSSIGTWTTTSSGAARTPPQSSVG